MNCGFPCYLLLILSIHMYSHFLVHELQYKVKRKPFSFFEPSQGKAGSHVQYTRSVGCYGDSCEDHFCLLFCFISLFTIICEWSRSLFIDTADLHIS